MFLADSNFHVIWDLIGFICIIYQMFVTPYRICFDADSYGVWYFIEIFIDSIFILDIFVSFNTSYIDKGILVAERKKVIWNYLKGWFLMDLIASFPYTYIIEYFVIRDEAQDTNDLSYLKTPSLLRLLKIIRILKVLRLLWVLKLKRLLYKIEEYIVTDFVAAIMDGIKIFILVFSMSHWMACAFYYISDFTDGELYTSWVISANF